MSIFRRFVDMGVGRSQGPTRGNLPNRRHPLSRAGNEGEGAHGGQLVLGTPDQLEDAMARSEDSKKPNTAYIERLNLHKRMSCSMLRRRTPAPGRSAERIQEALELVRVFYNFVTPHGSLKFGKVKRTPAMQAGIFDRPLTIREIFNWVPPTRPKWGRKAMVQMATEY